MSESKEESKAVIDIVKQYGLMWPFEPRTIKNVNGQNLITAVNSYRGYASNFIKDDLVLQYNLFGTINAQVNRNFSDGMISILADPDVSSDSSLLLNKTIASPIVFNWDTFTSHKVREPGMSLYEEVETTSTPTLEGVTFARSGDNIVCGFNKDPRDTPLISRFLIGNSRQISNVELINPTIDTTNFTELSYLPEERVLIANQNDNATMSLFDRDDVDTPYCTFNSAIVNTNAIITAGPRSSDGHIVVTFLNDNYTGSLWYVSYDADKIESGSVVMVYTELTTFLVPMLDVSNGTGLIYGTLGDLSAVSVYNTQTAVTTEVASVTTLGITSGVDCAGNCMAMGVTEAGDYIIAGMGYDVGGTASLPLQLVITLPGTGVKSIYTATNVDYVLTAVAVRGSMIAAAFCDPTDATGRDYEILVFDDVIADDTSFTAYTYASPYEDVVILGMIGKLDWFPEGKTLIVAGGNGVGNISSETASVYMLDLLDAAGRDALSPVTGYLTTPTVNTDLRLFNDGSLVVYEANDTNLILQSYGDGSPLVKGNDDTLGTLVEFPTKGSSDQLWSSPDGSYYLRWNHTTTLFELRYFPLVSFIGYSWINNDRAARILSSQLAFESICVYGKSKLKLMDGITDDSKMVGKYPDANCLCGQNREVMELLFGPDSTEEIKSLYTAYTLSGPTMLSQCTSTGTLTPNPETLLQSIMASQESVGVPINVCETRLVISDMTLLNTDTQVTVTSTACTSTGIPCGSLEEPCVNGTTLCGTEAEVCVNICADDADCAESLMICNSELLVCTPQTCTADVDCAEFAGTSCESGLCLVPVKVKEEESSNVAIIVVLVLIGIMFIVAIGYWGYSHTRTKTKKNPKDQKKNPEDQKKNSEDQKKNTSDQNKKDVKT